MSNQRNIENQIARLLGKERSGPMSVEDIIALLCQISLAVLIIFVMANVLFMARAKAEVDEAKGLLPHYRDRWDEVRSTDVGKEYEKREQTLVELQREKLRNALDGVEKDERIKLALSILGRKRPDGSVWYAVESILSDIRVSDVHFKEGCMYAKQVLPDQDKMRQDWLSRVLLLAGMRLKEGSGKVLITQEPQIVEDTNEEWLVTEIRKRVQSLYSDSCVMQRAALACLINQYRKKPELLKGTDAFKLMDRYLLAPSGERGMLVSQINSELYRYAKSVFEQQGVPLLSGV